MDKDLPNIFKGFVNDSNNQNESRLEELENDDMLF